VAREYGIPAVMSVNGVTHRIRDGQEIQVDGNTGIVTLLIPDGAKER
jgi:pyruvate,water dikinase